MFDHLIENAAAARQETGRVTEVERVIELPLRFLEPEGERLSRKWTGEFRRHPNAPPLFPKQAEVLEELALNCDIKGAGVLGAIGVGGGKTLAFLLMSRIVGAKKPLYLCPASLVEKTHEDIFEWSQHYDFVVPEIVSYARLSQPDSTAFLTKLKPDFIMADECQALANPEAARTKRFERYLRANPETRFAAMSGSIGGGDVERAHHICGYALRQLSPLPHTRMEAKFWGAVLDADADPGEKEVTNLDGLVDWAGTRGVGNSIEAGRLAFQHRFRTCPGVVSTDAMSCDVPLEITSLRPPVSSLIAENLKRVDKWERPDGESLVYATEKSQCAKQVSMGFYLVWRWPDGERDSDWLDARRTWGCDVRAYLQRYAREGCDSPALVENYIAAGKGPATMRSSLRIWEKQRKKRFINTDTGKLQPAPPQDAVWFDLGVLNYAVQWAKQQERALLWFHNQAVGEMLDLLGVPAMWGGIPNVGHTPVVALSLSVYNAGFNLQDWSNQLVLQMPSSGVLSEQMLGRTHRHGQKAKVVRASVFQHTYPYIQAMKRAKERALFAHQTFGQQQRLLQARFL